MGREGEKRERLIWGEYGERRREEGEVDMR